MGVYKEGKNWKVQVYYRDWQGNRKRKQKRGFRTKGEAKEWERDFLQQQTQSVDIEFGNFLELYYKDLMGIQTGVELSYLEPSEQIWLEEIHNTTGKYPSLEQAKKIKIRSEEKTLTKEILRLLIMGEKRRARTFTLKQNEINKYFTPDYDEQKMRSVIIELLEEWSNKNK